MDLEKTMLNKAPNERDATQEAEIDNLHEETSPPFHDAGGGVAGTSMPYASLIRSRRRSA